MNDFKCSFTYLVVVVHSLGLLLEQVPSWKPFGILLVDYLPLNHLEVCKALGGSSRVCSVQPYISP
jgi:hypothetical protein